MITRITDTKYQLMLAKVGMGTLNTVNVSMVWINTLSSYFLLLLKWKITLMSKYSEWTEIISQMTTSCGESKSNSIK